MVWMGQIHAPRERHARALFSTTPGFFFSSTFSSSSCNGSSGRSIDLCCFVTPQIFRGRFSFVFLPLPTSNNPSIPQHYVYSWLRHLPAQQSSTGNLTSGNNILLWYPTAITRRTIAHHPIESYKYYNPLSPSPKPSDTGPSALLGS